MTKVNLCAKGTGHILVSRVVRGLSEKLSGPALQRGEVVLNLVFTVRHAPSMALGIACLVFSVIFLAAASKMFG